MDVSNGTCYMIALSPRVFGKCFRLCNPHRNGTCSVTMVIVEHMIYSDSQKCNVIFLS